MRFLRLFALPLFAFTLPALAVSITGTVTNGTNHKPAAGDDVTLIRLAQGMQESTKTKTDGRGHFTIDVPDQGMHLVRVTHEKANYFRPAPPGTESVEFEVYDAAAKVAGVSLEANLFRVQTDEPGKTLRIVENFFVKNESAPPKTQYSSKSFEFALPAGAVIEGAAALSPNGMPVQSRPTPTDEPNHYAFDFPIRPGETRFQLSYTLPYSGSGTVSVPAITDTANALLVIPNSMKLESSSNFVMVPDQGTMGQSFVARDVKAGAPIRFVLSGKGELPRPQEQGDAAGGPQTGAPVAGGVAEGGAAAAASDTKPGGGMANPINTPDPLSKYKWWILGGLAVALAAGAGVMMRPPSVAPAAAVVGAPVASAAAVSTKSALNAVLRDELFTLESERLAGRITDEEYARLKGAFDLIFKRALEREGSLEATKNV